ncbi:MAG: hypothetical protein ACKVT0_02260 [Planctomycetaceae bacterium]
MPEFRGKKGTNDKLADSKAVSRWKILGLYKAQIDDDGIALLKDVAINLEEIQIWSDIITDRSLEILCALPKLRSLFLDYAPQVTDSGISYLTQAHELRELRLRDTQLTDKGINYFLSLQHIWSLDLTGTKITDKGVSKLTKLNELGIVRLDRTQIQGHGLKYLPDVSRTRCYLYVENCPISDDGLRGFLETHSSYDTISLSGTLITDALLPAIAAIKNLAELRLNNTMVSDDGVRFLCGHPSLCMLYVRGTRVSKEMVERLKREGAKNLMIYQEPRTYPES